MPGENELRKVIQDLETRCDFEVFGNTSLAGGSINAVYALNTSKGRRVLKLNQTSGLPGMFEAEKDGLDVLRSNSGFDIPEVYSVGTLDRFAYLLMEHKTEGRQSRDFWTQFAENLAGLHRNTASKFGFPSSNYIGSLPQYNRARATAGEFYISQRLEPQLKFAAGNGFRFNSMERILSNIASEVPEEPPALLHGDLWSGNYLINEQGYACLIDPAVSFGPREMDLAMMKLFGGFPEKVFSDYSELFPLSEGSQKRVPLWQLYYLLVHLNIFGAAYYPQVKAILNSFA